MPIGKEYYLLSVIAFAFAPLIALAEKGGPNPVMIQKPIALQPAPAAAIQAPPPVTKVPLPAVNAPSQPLKTMPAQVNKVPPAKVSIPSVMPAPTKPAPARIDTGKRSAGLPAAPTKPIPGVSSKIPADNRFDGINNSAIRDAGQMREMQYSRDATEALRNSAGKIEGYGGGMSPDLGLGGGSKGPDLPGHDAGLGFDPAGMPPLPTMPDNQNVGNTGGAPTGPQSPQGAMKGAAAFWPFDDDDDTATLPSAGPALPRGQVVNRGGPMGKHTTIQVLVNTSTRQIGDATVTTTEHRHTDGRAIYERVTRYGDGTLTYSQREYDKDGNLVSEVPEEIIPEGDGGIAELQGTEGGSSSGAWARYGAKISGQRPDLSLKTPNQVNPGPVGAMPAPRAPLLRLPEDQLVINPDPDNVQRGQAAMPNSRTAEMLRRHIKDGAGPGANPGTAPIAGTMEPEAPSGQ